MPINNVSPQLSIANSWSALQTFSAGLTVSGGQVVRGGSSGGVIIGNVGIGVYFDTVDATSASGYRIGGVQMIASGTSNELLLSPRNGGSGFILSDSASTRLYIDTANMLTLRNGTNAQAFSLYKTFTDASNYERLHWWADATNNVFRFDSEALGTGVVRNIAIMGGNVGIGTTTPASLLDLRTGNLTFSGANGQGYVQGHLTELTNVASGVTTQATTIQIPADAIVYSASVRVVTQPGGTATMTVTATTSGTAFQKGANISTVAGTTDPGTKNTPVNYNSVAAQTITYTFNAVTTNASGQIRIDIYYATATPPTS